MSDEAGGPPAVTLVDVHAGVLDALVIAAVSGADADEVTPVLGCPPGTGWSMERVSWLRAFHAERRAGLDGPLGEATWAVALDRRVVGSVRLASTEQPGVLVTGAWLTRDVRGAGVGRLAMTAVLDRATRAGASDVVAGTTSGNTAALAVLRRLGFQLAPGPDGAVRAHLELTL